jgi:hypothetical protein
MKASTLFALTSIILSVSSVASLIFINELAFGLLGLGCLASFIGAVLLDRIENGKL